MPMMFQGFYLCGKAIKIIECDYVNILQYFFANGRLIFIFLWDRFLLIFVALNNVFVLFTIYF